MKEFASHANQSENGSFNNFENWSKNGSFEKFRKQVRSINFEKRRLESTGLATQIRNGNSKKQVENINSRSADWKRRD